MYKLDSNFDRPSFPAVIHLFLLHHLMVHVCSVFGDTIVFSKSKKPLLCNLSGQKKAYLPVPAHREALPLFPSYACQTLFPYSAVFIAQRLVGVQSLSISSVHFSSHTCCGQAFWTRQPVSLSGRSQLPLLGLREGEGP